MPASSGAILTDAPSPANAPVAPTVATAAPAPDSDAGTAVRGIGLMIAFCTVAPMIDILAKLATATIPPGEVTLARFAVQAALLLPIAYLRRGLGPFSGRRIGLQVLRGLLVAVATICFITAISAMPVADAISIFFVEPLLLTLLSAWLLGEPVGWRRIAACLIGFVGAVIVVRPSFDELGWVATLPLVTALCFAFYLMLTRLTAQREDPIAMQAWAGLFAALAVAVALWLGEGSGDSVFDPLWPDRRGWLLILGVGVCATASHVILTYAFRFASASVLAPLQYLEIVAATGLGYWVFGDFPDALKWLGIAIIVGSGLFVFWRERRAG